MKKLLVVLMVLAFVAPAMADDTLDVSGSMRVEAYSISNGSFGDSDTEDRDFWDQRFRLQMKIKPADGVMAVLRADFTEDTWGSSNFNGVRVAGDASHNALMMVDRAYLSIDKGMVNINGGLNTFNLGNGIAYNNQGQGLQFTIKTPLVIRLGFTKESENGANDDTEAFDDDADPTTPDRADTEDTDSYWLDLGFKNDMMSINVFYAAIIDSRDGDRREPSVIGAQYKGKIGPVNLNAEVDIFGGDDGVGGDLIGTQFYGDVMLKLSDQVTVGSHLIYAAGTDATDEDQITAVIDTADVVIQDKILPQNGPGALQPFGAGDDVFDVGNNQGSIGLGPYVKFKVMDDLTIAAHIIWTTSASDAAVEAAEIDSRLFYGVGASWALAPKAKLDFGYTAANIEEGDNFVGELEDYSAFGAILSVSF